MLESVCITTPRAGCILSVALGSGLSPSHEARPRGKRFHKYWRKLFEGVPSALGGLEISGWCGRWQWVLGGVWEKPWVVRRGERNLYRLMHLCSWSTSIVTGEQFTKDTSMQVLPTKVNPWKVPFTNHSFFRTRITEWKLRQQTTYIESVALKTVLVEYRSQL